MAFIKAINERTGIRDHVLQTINESPRGRQPLAYVLWFFISRELPSYYSSFAMEPHIFEPLVQFNAESLKAAVHEVLPGGVFEERFRRRVYLAPEHDLGESLGKGRPKTEAALQKILGQAASVLEKAISSVPCEGLLKNRF